MSAYRGHLINQSRHPSDPAYEPPPDPEYFLVGKPRGCCPWCGSGLFTFGDNQHDCIRGCMEYDPDASVDENRIRYAAERLEDMQNDRT